jgi:hypothetical protein
MTKREPFEIDGIRYEYPSMTAVPQSVSWVRYALELVDDHEDDKFCWKCADNDDLET